MKIRVEITFDVEVETDDWARVEDVVNTPEAVAADVRSYIHGEVLSHGSTFNDGIATIVQRGQLEGQ